MRTRKMSKMLAAILSAAMVMSMSMTAFAANAGEVEEEAPIYAYDVDSVIVPADFAVAFNPDGLDVTTQGTTTSNAQIVSKNYGIVNKSSKDKIVTVTLNVSDQNDKITFVNTEAEVDNAAKDEYKVYLTAVAADTTEVKVGTTPASANANTGAADLANVSMTAATAAAVPLSAGENQIAFGLEKAGYALKTDAKIELGTTTAADIKDKYEVSTLAAAGKGITAFTFGGKMNTNTDWTQLGSAVKITAVYTTETAEGTITPVSGTGALYVNPAPKFSTGTDVGTISYTQGTGDDALKSITKIEMDNNGTVYDGYNALTGFWPQATDVSGVITLSSDYMSYYTNSYPDDSTRQATVTYVNENDETKTVNVNVKIR